MTKDGRYLRMTYFQKSKILFSLIAGRKYYDDDDPSLINTYLFADMLNESILDYYLLVEFEKGTVLDDDITQYLYSMYETDSNTNLYVFDLSSMKEDVNKFLSGEYSEFTEGSKDKILHYYGFYDKLPSGEYNKSVNIHELDGYLHFYAFFYPDRCKDYIAEEMEGKLFSTKNEALIVLSQMKELCEPYNHERETFKKDII